MEVEGEGREGGGGAGPPAKKRMRFREGAVEHGLKLLELPDGAEGTALLDAVLAGGASFKGAGDETVVLCTPSSTYGVKRVDTSNMMLLLDGWEGQGPDPGAADAPATQLPGDGDLAPSPEGLATQRRRAARLGVLEVSATCVDTLEVFPAAPDYQKLQRLMGERQYGADAAEGGEAEGLEAGGAPGHWFHDISREVRACDADIRAWLEEQKCLHLEGKWMTIDDGYKGYMLELLLAKVDEKGWALDALPVAAVAEAMGGEDFRPEVVEHFLRAHGAVSADGATCALDMADMARHFAEKLLAKRGKWYLDPFLAAWKEEFIMDFTPTEDMLKGVAIVETTKKLGKQIREVVHFPLAALPCDPAQRFDALFRKKERWTQSELEPYLPGLTRPTGVAREVIVSKWTRSFRPDPKDAASELVYTRRWPGPADA